MATKSGPRPLPKSAKVFNSAKAVPRDVGIVTFVKVALTIGPVTPLPMPANIAAMPYIIIL